MRWSPLETCRITGGAYASAVVGALVAGCAASGPDYGAYLARWQGKAGNGVIADWGPPDYRYRDHRGRDTLQYIEHQVVFESLSGGRRVVWWCLTNFHIGPGGLVRDISTEGNHCFPPDDLAKDRARRKRGGRTLPMVPPSDRAH